MPNSNSIKTNKVTTIATSAVSTTINSNNNNNNNSNNDTVTLRNLTAYDMLDERINMLELFNLADTSEIDKYKLCYNIERQQILLKTLKNKIDLLKQTK